MPVKGNKNIDLIIPPPFGNSIFCLMKNWIMGGIIDVVEGINYENSRDSQSHGFLFHS